MSETNTTPPLVAPPGWQEAMQGKTSNAKRVAASKRIFLILTLTFFGMMTWLYIIYSLGHSKKAGAGEVPAAASVPGGGADAPIASAAPGGDFSNQFGTPRGVEAPAAVAPMGYQTTAMPQTMAQPAPAEFGAPAGVGNPYATAGFGQQPIPTVAQKRGGITITAPRDLRHQVGVEGGSMPGMANIPSQRMRMFVAR